jgi:hypothetical protein
MKLWVLTFDEPRFEDESPQLFSWGDARHATTEEVLAAAATVMEAPLQVPLLGLATTGELMAELSARIEVHGPGLDYRTVEGE